MLLPLLVCGRLPSPLSLCRPVASRPKIQSAAARDNESLVSCRLPRRRSLSRRPTNERTTLGIRNSSLAPLSPAVCAGQRTNKQRSLPLRPFASCNNQRDSRPFLPARRLPEPKVRRAREPAMNGRNYRLVCPRDSQVRCRGVSFEFSLSLSAAQPCHACLASD